MLYRHNIRIPSRPPSRTVPLRSHLSRPRADTRPPGAAPHAPGCTRRRGTRLARSLARYSWTRGLDTPLRRFGQRSARATLQLWRRLLWLREEKIVRTSATATPPLNHLSHTHSLLHHSISSPATQSPLPHGAGQQVCLLFRAVELLTLTLTLTLTHNNRSRLISGSLLDRCTAPPM
jgi:hypothetical protein